MVYEDISCITDEILTHYYNGEEQTLVLDQLQENSFQLRPRVKTLYGYWSYGNTYKELEIDFDEDEIFEAFRSMWQDDSSIQAELQLSMNKTNNHCRVFLVSCDEKLHKRIELRRARIKIYTIENPAIIDDFEVNINKNGKR